MAKGSNPRKMLGNPNSPACQRMMRQIETQSRETLARWALAFARERYVPIFQEQRPNDQRMQQLLQVSAAAQAGELSRKQEKEALQATRKTMGELDHEPIAQAAARAILTACGVWQTPTNALGFLFYGAAASAYAQEGLGQTPERYEELAQEEFTLAAESLAKVSVAEEPAPVTVNWNC